jgi:hypothetical protein
MILREIGLGGCGLDSTGSGQGPVADCCECGDEPSCSCATESFSWPVSKPDSHITRLLIRIHADYDEKHL